MTEKKPAPPSILNRRATHDFHISKKFVAGLQLQGSEVKSCREGKVQLVDSYAAFDRGELFLYKAHIAEYKQSGPHFNHVPTRKRKLLMRRQELRKLEQELKTSGTTLVPMKIFFNRGFVKLELGLGTGKTKGDKRQSIKAREEKRSADQARKIDRRKG